MKKSILILALGVSIFSCKKDDTTTPTPPPTSTVNLPEEFQDLAGIFDGNGIGAAVNLTEDIVIFFNMDGDKYAWFEDNEVHITKNLADSDGHFANYSLASVGATTMVAGGSVYLFEVGGVTYTTLNFDVNDVDEGYIDNDVFTFSGNTHQLTEWGPDNTCPYTMVSAMWNYSNPGSECFGASEDVEYTWMVNGSGDEYVKYYSSGGGEFQEADELENWLAPNNCTGPDGIIPFDKISASCRYIKPNTIQELFFDEDGKSFSLYNVSEGVFSEVYKLY